MKKIHFYLILVYSINFYANDSITAVSIKNINLREQATTNSKILSDVKADDTLKIISKENEWSNVIYKDSLNGYVKSEFIKGIKNVKAEILKLEVMKKLFFKVLFLISILCFGLLYLLKKKLMQFEINGKASLIAKSIILSFIITVMATAYFFYDLLSFFKIFGIIILLLFLIYKTYNIFFYEKLIKLNKDFFIDEEQGQNITIVNNNYIDEIIGNEKLNLERIKNNLDEIKSHIRRILENEYSYNEVISLVLGVEPIIGMPKQLVNIYFGKPEKIETENNANYIREKYRYGYIRTYYNKEQYELDIVINNNIVESFIKK